MTNNEHEIEPEQLMAMMKNQEDFQLLDVREPAEFAEGRIPGSIFIPLGQVAARLGELDRTKKTIIHCRSGVRSATACGVLESNGFNQVLNLRGGILAWENENGMVVPG